MSKTLGTLLLIFSIPLIAAAQQFSNFPRGPEISNSYQFGPLLNNRAAQKPINIASEVNVAAFGALGDGKTDDTVAIQNALAAACSPPDLPGVVGIRADLVFPPGEYLVTQTQAPSTAPILSSCSALRFLGLGGSAVGTQFVSSPQARIIVQPGPSPNSAPVISAPYGSGNGVTIENLLINGYNQAVLVGGAVVHLKNDCLTTVTTGMPDNTPLEIRDTLWVWFQGGCLQTFSPQVPGIEIVNDNVAAATGIIDIEDVIGIIGAVQVNVRAHTSSGVLGNLEFRNVTIEDATTDFLTVTNTSGYFLYLNGLRFENVNLADGTSGSLAVVNFDAGTAGGRLSGAHMVDVGSNGGPIIKTEGGQYSDIAITGCYSNCIINSDGTSFSSYAADYVSSLITGIEATAGNCQSSTSPAACGAAQAGMVAVPADAKTLNVTDTSVTATSEIHLTFDSSIGEALGVTCNTGINQPSVSSRTPHGGFTISLPEAATPNPDCITFRIVN